MFKFLSIAALALVFVPAADAQAPVARARNTSGGFGPAFQQGLGRGLGFSLGSSLGGGFGAGRLGLGYGGGFGFGARGLGALSGVHHLAYGQRAAFLGVGHQGFCAQPFIQSYAIAQPFQAVQQVYAQPIFQGLGVDHCGLGVQSIIGGGCGLGFRQFGLQRSVFRSRSLLRGY